MGLSELVEASIRVAGTTRRNEKIDLLSSCLRRSPANEVAIGVNYLSGLLPQGRIGIGGAALRRVSEVPTAALPTLQLDDVDDAFTRIARTGGSGASDARERQLAALFARATSGERDFLIRLLIGELRQGAQEGVMLEAVARAAGVSASEVRRAAMVAGTIGPVAAAALTEGAAGLGRFRLQLMQPLRPMLAQPAEDVTAAVAAFSDAAIDYKLDGARLQVHKADEDVRVFSRQLNDVTASVPEIVDAVRALPAARLILDGEAIGLASDGRPLTFQTTMRRFGRKQDVERLRAELPLSAFFFDCLHRDGADLIAVPARERFRTMADLLPPALQIPRRFGNDPDEARAFLEEALARGHEGVVVKSLDAIYEAGNRGSVWLKIKAAHTLDLVVLAAEWGSGRRRGWLSNLHLGARDPRSGQFVMLGKTFKGMTDRVLAWQTERLLQLEVTRDAYTVYVQPRLVVEIEFNGVQASPHYPGGLALRFARLKRYREDKTPDEVDTIDTVRAVAALPAEMPPT
ncbi:MAG: ATP-dependent DNA ligase [Sulfurifustaceae bacterium]